MKAIDTTDAAQRVKSQRVTERRQTKRLGMRQSQHSGEQKGAVYRNSKKDMSANLQIGHKMLEGLAHPKSLKAQHCEDLNVSRYYPLFTV